MTRRVALGGFAVVVLVGACAGVWAAGSELFADSLDDEEQAVVDEVEAGGPEDPGEAAGFVEDHLDVLLSADVADAVEPDALAELFAGAFDDRGTQAELFPQVVAAVAGEGEIHSDEVRPVLAEAVGANLALVDEWVNAPFLATATVVPQDVRDDYLDLHDLLRETMRDRQVAEGLQAQVDAYGSRETAAAPDAGGERTLRLRGLGRVQSFFHEAQRNAAPGQPDEDESAAIAAVWLVTDLYGSELPEGAAVRDAARGRSFVDPDGTLKTAMSQEEVRELRRWATSQIAEGGPAVKDYDSIARGGTDVTHPPHGIDIVGRA